MRRMGYHKDESLAVDPAFLFTAQPQAPAAAKNAGACGWAVND